MFEVEGKVLVSGCLAGIKCNYKGEAKPNNIVLDLVRQGRAVVMCPEQLGGLLTPRNPAERKGKKVVTKDGDDVTIQFEKGADIVVKAASEVGCIYAILKARSPSCGSGEIYDGTFTGKLTPGDGVLAEKLKKAGIKVISEEEL